MSTNVEEKIEEWEKKTKKLVSEMSEKGKEVSSEMEKRFEELKDQEKTFRGSSRSNRRRQRLKLSTRLKKFKKGLGILLVNFLINGKKLQSNPNFFKLIYTHLINL